MCQLRVQGFQLPMSDADDDRMFLEPSKACLQTWRPFVAEADRADIEVIKSDDDGDEVDYSLIQSDSQKASSWMGPTGPPPKAATAAGLKPTSMATPITTLAMVAVSQEPPPPPPRQELPNCPIPNLATQRLPKKIKIGNFVYNLAEDF